MFTLHASSATFYQGSPSPSQNDCDHSQLPIRERLAAVLIGQRKCCRPSGWYPANGGIQIEVSREAFEEKNSSFRATAQHLEVLEQSAATVLAGVSMIKPPNGQHAAFVDTCFGAAVHLRDGELVNAAAGTVDTDVCR